MNLYLPSHPKDHPYTCARAEDQGRVGPQQSWLDRVRPNEHKEMESEGCFNLGWYRLHARRTQEKEQKGNSNKQGIGK